MEAPVSMDKPRYSLLPVGNFNGTSSFRNFSIIKHQYPAGTMFQLAHTCDYGFRVQPTTLTLGELMEEKPRFRMCRTDAYGFSELLNRNTRDPFDLQSSTSNASCDDKSNAFQSYVFPTTSTFRSGPSPGTRPISRNTYPIFLLKLPASLQRIISTLLGEILDQNKSRRISK